MGLLYDTLLAVHDIHAGRQSSGVRAVADELSVDGVYALCGFACRLIFAEVNHRVNARRGAICHTVEVQAHRLYQRSARRFKPTAKSAQPSHTRCGAIHIAIVKEEAALQVVATRNNVTVEERKPAVVVGILVFELLLVFCAEGASKRSVHLHRAVTSHAIHPFCGPSFGVEV